MNNLGDDFLFVCLQKCRLMSICFTNVDVDCFFNALFMFLSVAMSPYICLLISLVCLNEIFSLYLDVIYFYF